MDVLNAIILGIIEGLTEFIPVSSTGHLVIARPLLGVSANDEPWKTLLWVSQFGAILAVVVYLWRDLAKRLFHRAVGGWSNHLAAKLAIAMAPTIILALIFKKRLDPLEDMPLAVAGAFIVGALLMEWIDRRFRRQTPMDLDDVTLEQAFWIGFIQSISMWPGVSRSGASIMGGMVLGLSPRVATEFSFYLAIPTMFLATVKTVWDNRNNLYLNQLSLIGIGTATSFIVALLVVAWLLNFVKKYRFTVFAVYRIVLGLVVIGMHYAGKL